MNPGGFFVLEPQKWESYAKAKRMDPVAFRVGLAVLSSDRTLSGPQREGEQPEIATRWIPGDPRGYRLRS